MNCSYIEIVGVPGAGKTFIASSLVQKLNDRGVKAVARPKLGRGIFGKIILVVKASVIFCKNRSLRAAALLKVNKTYKGVRHVNTVVRNLKIRLVWELVVVQQACKKHDKDIFIHDEGIIGRIVALSVLTEMSKDLFDACIAELVPEGTKVMYVRILADKAILHEKHRAIVLPFFSENTGEVIQTYYEQCIERYEALQGVFSVATVENNSTEENLLIELSRVADELVAVHHSE